MRRFVTIALVAACAIAACGDDEPAGGGEGSTASSTGATADSTGASAGQESAGDTATTSADATSADATDDGDATDTGELECEPFGRWPAPVDTFTLPAVAGEAIVYADVQASFPDVDWAGVDRLYIPAGQYLAMQLGNLPERDPADPLVITNSGGQVRIGPNDPAGNYLWVMSGGSNWVLTGRYDPEAGTGDESAPGHRCSDYAGARGHYGFWSDDAFAQREYLHMGLAVSDATAFELEFVEIERSGFAGIRLLNGWVDGAPLPMADVEVHDTYVHDVDGEGIYFGWTGAPPANLQPGMHVHHNRFVRTGNEALQVQDLGPGSEIHHNVVAFAALHWRDNGLGAFQDGNAQIVVRSGDVSIHHNVFVGGGGTLVSFWSQPQGDDGARQVTFADNYVADTRNLGVYFGGTSDAESTFAFTGNVLRGLEFTYTDLDPGATAPTSVFRIGEDIAAMVELTDNRWEGDLDLVVGGTVVDEGNVQGPVDAIEFVQSGYPDGEAVARLEAWTAVSTLAPGMPARTYVAGDLVMHDATMYRALAESTDALPPDHPELWEALPDPVDDLRAQPPYDDLGIP
ncbi:MAG TPA: hypothetical protein VFG69_19205 [Nannocystaceae bacterium]|nr:hypothetical protein [Nannocystaceae bacterium]